MNFRKLVALIGAAVIVVALIVVGIAVTAITQTDVGREQLRNIIVTRVAASVKGKMYLGRMRGGLFSAITIDSLEIRDEDDSLFIATGPITARYDPRDLVDGRLIFSVATVDRPTVVLRQHHDGQWNFRRIFPKRKTVVPRGESRFGRWFVLDSAHVRDASVILTMPWEPADSLEGTKRDSAIAWNLRRPDREVRRAAGGFTRTWRWNNAFIAASHVRLAHPDTVGRAFDIARLDVNEIDPPFRFRRVESAVRWAGDTIWFRAPKFDLPGSTGRAAGKLIWGSDKPVRYDVAVRGDSVSLADVSWVYPTLPTEGGGSMFLRIRNDPRNLRVIDYALSRMDVRTQGSRLRGAMTFGVGGPVLVVKDVDLEASPVDVRLLRTLNGKPFPYDWAGTLTGTVRGAGGPVNRFRVDEARLVFRDAHVPGAITRATASGELDILFPAFTKFRGLRVDVAQLDLRTPRYVNPDFPRLNGFVSGHAVLDSSWLDVRFRDAELAHRDGDGPESRFTGSGRVTFEDEFLRYDLDLIARPVSFTTLARSYPLVPLRGSYEGPLRIAGTLEDLDVQGTLAGAGGTMTVAGRFDFHPSRYLMRGTLAVANLDLRTLLGRETVPSTDLTARIQADVAGDSAANLAGMLSVAVDRSRVDRLRLYDSRARFILGNGRLTVDTVALETSAATIAAAGAIGLSAAVRDSLRFVVHMDSLGGFRQYLRARQRPDASGALPASTVALDDPVRDSLSGAARAEGWLVGNLERLDLEGGLDGRALYLRGDRIERATATARIRDLLAAPHGGLEVKLDQIVAAGIRLDSVRASVTMPGARQGRVAVSAVSANGPTASLGASVTLGDDTTTVALEEVTVRVGGGRWTLAAPAMVHATRGGVAMQPIRLAASDGGWAEIAGTLPTAHEVAMRIRADSVRLADFGTLAQLQSPLGGRLSLDWTIGGHRESPSMRFAATVHDFAYGGAEMERVRIDGGYDDRRLLDTLVLYRRGAPVLTAITSLPLDLALIPVARRLLSDSISGRVRADSVELAVLEMFTPLLRQADGIFIADVALGGTVREPRATGRVAIVNGSASVPNAGLRLQRIGADLRLTGEGLRIERMVAQSGEMRGDTATLGGFVSFEQLRDPTFALNFTARSFSVVNRRSFAELKISTAGRGALTLDGRWSRARLRGSLLVDQGSVYIPEVFQKQLTDLSDPDLAAMVDTASFATRVLLPDAPSELVRNLSLEGVDVIIGDELWIRSPEANIKLSGRVDVTRSEDPRDPTKSRLALVGTLNADRGTYTLSLPLVQRTFQVENGVIRFFGEADMNPTLDINAIHTVRQSNNKQDIRIRVHLGGTMRQPMITLSSADGYRIDQPQLLSYLITGAPHFESTEEETATEKALSVALRSAGGLLSSRLSGVLGLEVVQIQTAGYQRGLFGRTGISGSTFGDYLRSTRIDLGWQLTDRVFVSANTGLCKFDPTQFESTRDYLDAVGVKVDYRLPRELILSAGTEPGTMALICNAEQSQMRGFIQTPRQFGFDLSKTWRF